MTFSIVNKQFKRKVGNTRKKYFSNGQKSFKTNYEILIFQNGIKIFEFWKLNCSYMKSKKMFQFLKYHPYFRKKQPFRQKLSNLFILDIKMVYGFPSYFPLIFFEN